MYGWGLLKRGRKMANALRLLAQQIHDMQAHGVGDGLQQGRLSLIGVHMRPLTIYGKLHTFYLMRVPLHMIGITQPAAVLRKAQNAPIPQTGQAML